jgi:hypothetical protein
MTPRLAIVALLAAMALFTSFDLPTPHLLGATAAAEDIGSKEAFEAAKELGTADAWNAFLNNYPEGFHADLARAYLKKLGGAASKPAPARKPEVAESEAEGGEIPLGPNVSLGGRRLLPDDSPWHEDISDAPVDPRSGKILARIGLDKPLRADFGPEWEGAPMGIPYVVVGADQERVPVSFLYADESDPGPYPVPPDAPIEGGPQGDGDRHVLVLDRDTWQLWELFNAFPDGKGGWKADGGALWNLKENQVRPAEWTSADAAGLPILPGLARYDEVVEKGEIAHALRFTLAKTRRAYVPPASHWASPHVDEDLPPMGMRVRLKGDYDTSGFGPEAKVILEALKKYGMFLADNGSDLFISGAPDERWNVDALRELMRVTTKDFEVVEMTGLVADKRRN